MTDKMAELFKNSEKLNLVLSPEGTRRPVADWKRGFYYIAKKAGVPILPLVLDYAKKEVIIKPLITPTDNEEQDYIQFKSIFVGAQGKYPNKFLTGLE